MIRINVFIKVKEENRSAVIKTAKELVLESKKEEGCIAYDFFESTTRSDVFMICETWSSPHTVESHEKAKPFKTLVPVLQSLAELKVEKFEF